MRLWYRHPALSWHEALPLGNGRMGAMIFGGTDRERVMLNDDTLWSGYPRRDEDFGFREHLEEARDLISDGRYFEAQQLIESHPVGGGAASYLPMGDLSVEFDESGGVSDYRRELDLSTGISTVSYRVGDCLVEREGFCSAPDQLFVYHLSFSGGGGMRFACSLGSALNHSAEKVGNEEIALRGYCPVRALPPGSSEAEPVLYDASRGMRFQVSLRVLASSGCVECHGNRIVVDDSGEATLLVSVATSYNGFDRDPATDGGDPEALCAARLDACAGAAYEELRARHIRDHGELFGRVSIDLGTSEAANLPTDERVVTLAAGDDDPELAALFFQYGRYLLMASSRPGSQPANLQGLWNESVRPPWSCNMTANINLEMNYWLAEPCNLSECHTPLFDMLAELELTGARVARELYGCRGWVAHHGIDIWRKAGPSDGSASWSFWPMAGPWLSQHLWDHYAFNGDREFLARVAYPIMKGAALFCLDWLLEDEQGRLVTSPSTSPENSFLTSTGERCAVGRASTMDMSLIWQLFTHCIEAQEVLGVDEELRGELEAKRKRLYPLKVGRRGQLQEWFLDFDEADPGHRHVAHLYPLHPGSRIHARRDSELAVACRRTLDLRIEHEGKDTIGWCFAWYISIFARLLDGDTAYSYLVKLMKNPFPNLLNAHRHPKLKHYPLTLEANYGATAGIAELLLQSHTGTVDLLPALPAAWPHGSVSGLRARGGFTVDMSWEAGELQEARIHSAIGGLCRLRTHLVVGVKSDGVPVQAERSADGVTVFETSPGQSYSIVPRAQYRGVGAHRGA